MFAVHVPLRLPALCAVALAALAIPATASAKKTAAPKLPVKFQQRYHVKSAVADPDHDGLTNFTEYRAHTSPKKADSDRDGVEDGSEDYDGDKLDGATEQRAGTDPGKRDSDHDRKPDGREDADHDGLDNLAEQRTANDPGDPDSDDDGVKDGSEHAGQVVSFAGGTLTLRLASTGKLVTGAVDGDTSVECGASAGGDEDVTASAAVATPRAADDFPPVEEGDADADAATADDDGATGDPCLDETLTAGAWVHEAELTTGEDGAPLFGAIALVDDPL